MKEMRTKLRILNKAFIAMRALVRSFIGVRAHMTVERLLSCEFLETLKSPNKQLITQVID